jgi:hypothetical protein
MSKRVDDLLVRADQLNSETIEFISNLTDPDLATPCEDPECPTVGDVVVHLAEGSQQLIGWAAGALQGQSGGAKVAPGPGNGHSHGPGGPEAAHTHGPAGHTHGPEAGHTHGPAGHTHGPEAGHTHGPEAVHIHKDDAIQVMKRGWMMSAGMLKNLTDEQLDAVPPIAQGISDGSTPLLQIITSMMDHQEQHLNYMKSALGARVEK